MRTGGEPRGQALVEFAMAISLFVIILVGLFDLGRGVFNYNTLSQASREGVRLASVQANWIGETGSNCTVPVCPADAAAMKANVVAAVNERASGLGTITDAQVKIHCSSTAGKPADTSTWTGNNCASGNGPGQAVTVRVEFTFIPMINLGNIDMSSQTTMVVN